jgi:predicted Na+-dependent transporter
MILISVENVPIILHRYHELVSKARVQDMESYLALVLGVAYLMMNVYWLFTGWWMSRINQLNFAETYQIQKERRASLTQLLLSPAARQ